MQIADFNGSASLSRDEFDEALAFSGVHLKVAQVRMAVRGGPRGVACIVPPSLFRQVGALFRAFDRDGSGTISYDEFVRALGENFNERRQAIVGKAFKLLDKDNSGQLVVADLRGVYNAKRHPDVISGKTTEDAVLSTFLNGLEGSSGNHDGTVTREVSLCPICAGGAVRRTRGCSDAASRAGISRLLRGPQRVDPPRRVLRDHDGVRVHGY